jgi:A/G-specific adenine glycosylase
LLQWYDASHRDLPWRHLKGSPEDVFYRVWLSEIMLQQTRVEAVIPYYERFLARFPSIEMLAQTEEHAVLAAWSGLGYYSRARNLRNAAKQIASAGLPSTWESIRALNGVGEYTAAAVGSIALGLAHAAVDGNVLRVVARLTNDGAEITAPATRRRIAEVAAALLDRKRPGDFNQAMMELGATVCVPGTPRCDVCPVARWCEARAAGTQSELPVKLKTKRARDVKLHLAVAQDEDRILLVQRAASERRLAGFWELPVKSLFTKQRGRRIAEFRHQIVDDRFLVTLWRITGKAKGDGGGEWLPLERLATIPLTTITKKALLLAEVNL